MRISRGVKIVSIIVVILIITATFYAVSPKEVAPTDPLISSNKEEAVSKYANEKFGYTVYIPDQWSVSEDITKSAIVHKGLEKVDDFSTVDQGFLIKGTLDYKSVTQNEIKNAFLEQIAKGFIGDKVEEITLNNGLKILKIFSGSIENNTKEVKYILINKAIKLEIHVVGKTENDFSKIEEILKTLSVN